jgi:hypothetical protein
MPPSSWTKTQPRKQQAELLIVAARFMLVAWETRHMPEDNIFHGDRSHLAPGHSSLHSILHSDRSHKLRSSKLEQSVAER